MDLDIKRYNELLKKAHEHKGERTPELIVTWKEMDQIKEDHKIPFHPGPHLTDEELNRLVQLAAGKGYHEVDEDERGEVDYLISRSNGSTGLDSANLDHDMTEHELPRIVHSNYERDIKRILATKKVSEEATLLFLDEIRILIMDHPILKRRNRLCTFDDSKNRRNAIIRNLEKTLKDLDWIINNPLVFPRTHHSENQDYSYLSCISCRESAKSAHTVLSRLLDEINEIQEEDRKYAGVTKGRPKSNPLGLAVGIAILFRRTLGKTPTNYESGLFARILEIVLREIKQDSSEAPSRRRMIELAVEESKERYQFLKSIDDYYTLIRTEEAYSAGTKDCPKPDLIQHSWNRANLSKICGCRNRLVPSTFLPIPKAKGVRDKGLPRIHRLFIRRVPKKNAR